MRVWLLKVGESIPVVSGAAYRPFRMGMIANELVARGAEVLWWASSFDHAHKRPLFPGEKTVSVASGYDIHCLHGILYRRSVGIGRLVNHLQVERSFCRQTSKFARPDVILAALPTPGLARAAVSFGLRESIPVVVDLRDMWPDVVLDTVPSWGRFVGRLLLDPMFRDTRYACANATALTGITPDFVEWGLRYACRGRSQRDRDFPLAYAPVVPNSDDVDRANRFWSDRGLHADDNAFIACFFGVLGHNANLQSVVSAARKLERGPRAFKFVLCGNGDRFDELRNATQNLSNVLLPGWVGQAEIWALKQKARVALAPYEDTFSFRASIPNKIIEYLSAGLPILSTLSGLLQRLLADEGCGFTYDGSDGDALVSYLIRLHDNPSLRQEMATRAVSVFQQRFSAQQVYGAMAEYLGEIAKGGCR